jgi:replicative DNA helicase
MKKQYRKKKEVEYDYGENVIPHDKDIEQVVLGAVLLESHVIDNAIADFSPKIFYTEANRVIAEAMIDLYKFNQPIDLITVCQKLREKGQLELVGGAYYVSSLSNRLASSANFEFYIKILQQKALSRSLLNICSKAIQSAFSEMEDIFDVYAELQTELEESIKDVLHYEVSKVREIHIENVKESLRVLEEGKTSGVRSGLRAVDELTNGWQKSDLIILAGRPSMGKTAAAVSMGIFPALVEGKAVAIFSLEMSKEQLTGRIESWISELDVSRIIKKQLTKDELYKMDELCQPLYSAPIYIDDTPNISLLELKSKCRKLVKENKVELIVVDYLQLMRSGMNIGNREQEIAEISRGLKAIAKELSIPVIALSQLSRVVEGRSDKKPMLSDLRESGQIEQDADMVLFCYRPEYYDIETYEIDNQSFNSTGLFMLIFAKHRNGELGEIPLTFIHSQTKLKNYNYVADEEWDRAVEEKKRREQFIVNNSNNNNNINTQENDNEPPF